MNEELQPKWYEDIKLSELKNIIKDNIGIAGRSFVTIGYYLKNIRDRELYLEDGYNSIWEFAQSEFGIGKSSASRFMAINDRFSEDGNSPILLEQYKDFGSSKLSEMLTLSDEQLDQVTITTTRTEIREMKQPDKTEVVAHAQQEPEPKTIDDLDLSVSAYNSLKKHGIHTISQLCEYTENELLHDWKIGDFYTKQIIKRLDDIGRCLKQDEEAEAVVISTFEKDGNAYGWTWSETVKDLIKEMIKENMSIDELIEGTDNLFSSLGKTYVACCFDERYITIQNDNCESIFKIATDRFEDEHKYYCSSVIETEETVPEHIEIVLEEPESVVEEPESVIDEAETVSADVVQTIPEESFIDQCETKGLKFNAWLKSNDSSIANIINDILYDIELSGNVDNISTKIRNGLISKLLVITESYYSYLTKELNIESPKTKPIQPELPILKNNEQRKEFIEAYQSWPVWIDQELTGERYYRYNLTDKVAMVVKVSLRHIYQSYKETKEIDLGAEQYYLLGIRSEWTSKGNTTVEDETRTFYECNTNKSALVDYLKEFQKK